MGFKKIISNTYPEVVIDTSTHYIPDETAFKLEVNLPDVSDVGSWTFCWEQYDRDGTMFRSYLPSSRPNRDFPAVHELLNDWFWEHIDELNFRITVRDNQIIGGGVVSEHKKILISPTKPFEVIYPTEYDNFLVGSKTLIEWEVGATQEAPIKCNSVAIALSLDGGNSFPIVITDSTKNSGKYSWKLGKFNTSEAVIRIECNDNIFFAVSDLFEIMAN